MKQTSLSHIHFSSRVMAFLGIALLATILFLLTGNASSDNLSPVNTTAVQSARLASSDSPPAFLPTVCLSPGHPSYVGDKYFEAVINRKVAHFLKFSLREAGYNVVLSTNDLGPRDLFSYGFKNDDQTYWRRLDVQTPEDKAMICNEADADYVISIHHNFAYKDNVNQTLVFYGVNENYKPEYAETEDWAQLTARRLGEVMKTDSSKTFADMNRLGFPLGIIVNSNAPTILTEGSFYSHPQERKRLNDDDYLEQEALAIFDAFHIHYKTQHEDDEKSNSAI